MGPNAGNGIGGMEMQHLQGHGHNQPPATEYTLQGVMRFLQTEWHRHERDRNAWEIEKQEMRGRIANLEGQVRRADATQKALRKYVAILERKVKDQAGQLKGSGAVESEEAAAANDRAAKIQEKLKSANEKHIIPGVDGIDLEKTDDESQRNELKTYLDQCQSEFMYLMMTPANPQPPRESPPLPMMEDLRDLDAFGNPGGQPMERQYPSLHQGGPQNHMQGMDSRQQQVQNHNSQMQQHPPANFMHKSGELQPQAMIRSSNEHQPVMYSTSNDWNHPVSVSTRSLDDNNSVSEPSTAVEVLGGVDDSSDYKDKPTTSAPNDADGWEFPEGTFPEPGAAAANSNRPDTDTFPAADNIPKSPNRVPGSHRRKGSMSRRRSAEHEQALSASQKVDSHNFKLRFGLRGHLDTVRTVIFSGGGSPGEPEICTAGDDGMVKRFHIPRLDGHTGAVASGASDLDVIANFTHRGHSGAVLSLASWSPAPNFSTGGRAQGDGWIFSGGQDATIRVWERGRVDPKATLEGHTDAVWALCVLPATLGAVFGDSSPYGTSDRILLVSGSADGSVRLWSVSAPPQLSSPQPSASRAAPGRGGRVRGNSMSSGSGFASTPQPSVASNSPFSYTLIAKMYRSEGNNAVPTSVTPLGSTGEAFVVSYSDAVIAVWDTKTGNQVGLMDSLDTYDGSLRTGVNSIVTTTAGLDQGHQHQGMGEEENTTGGPTGGEHTMTGSGVEGTIISGHEDRFIRFFDANSGQCTYNMLAHPDAISSLSLSPDGLELVSAGHDASLRFWSLEKRSCIQEMTSHRVMRGEGICSVVWSQDGKWVVSGGGDGVVKVFAR